MLLDYPVAQKTPEIKVELLRDGGDRMFIAQSGLLSRQEAPNHTSEFGADSWAYELEPGQSELRVPLRWTSPDGLEVTKTFLFRADSYEVEVEHRVTNGGPGAWAGSAYEQLQQSIPGDEEKAGFTSSKKSTSMTLPTIPTAKPAPVAGWP